MESFIIDQFVIKKTPQIFVVFQEQLGLYSNGAFWTSRTFSFLMTIKCVTVIKKLFHRSINAADFNAVWLLVPVGQVLFQKLLLYWKKISSEQKLDPRH